jgi:hypothetical protein
MCIRDKVRIGGGVYPNDMPGKLETDNLYVLIYHNYNEVIELILKIYPNHHISS